MAIITIDTTLDVVKKQKEWKDTVSKMNRIQPPTF